MNKILEMEFYRELNVSRSVAFWNYWDHEHLDVVHDGYRKSDILYEKKNVMLRIDYVNIPIPLLPFITLRTVIFMVQEDENTLYTYAVQMGIVSKTTIKIEEIKKDYCHFTMNYKFELNGWRVILRPLLRKLIPIWNERVWREDLPLKIRRQKVLRNNFKDFHGLPEEIKDREYHEAIEDLKLPIRRPRKSARDKHPMKE
jgi:hypothetical protein